VAATLPLKDSQPLHLISVLTRFLRIAPFPPAGDKIRRHGEQFRESETLMRDLA
jgi:hypothetical protein